MIDYSKLPRSEKLYVLSQVCIANSVTPDSPGYAGLIIRVCTSKFAMSRETAETYAADLKSAYEADYWEGLAAKHQPETDSVEAEPTTNTPRVFEDTPKTLDALNKLNFQSSTPIKKVEPQLAFPEPTYAPATITKQLIDLARKNDFNGVGRITLSEARYYLDDKTLRCEDIIRLIKQYYPKMDVEQRTGNVLLVYFDGKNNLRNIRDIHKVIQPATIILHPEVYHPPKLNYVKDTDDTDTSGDGVPTGTEQIDADDSINEVE